MASDLVVSRLASALAADALRAAARRSPNRVLVSTGLMPSTAPRDRRGAAPLTVSIDTVRLVAGIERVTRQLLDLLAALLDAHLRNQEVHGYALMKRTGLSGPSIYRGLDRLEDANLVDARWEEMPPGDERPRRCYYRLNPSGVVIARKLLAERRPEVLAGMGRTRLQPAPGLRMAFNNLFRRLALTAGSAE